MSSSLSRQLIVDAASSYSGKRKQFSKPQKTEKLQNSKCNAWVKKQFQNMLLPYTNDIQLNIIQA